MIFHWPQMIVAALMLFGIGISVAKYGQQKTDKYDITDVLIGPGIVAALLYFGGFWTGGNP
jgi:hypothetical protein